MSLEVLCETVGVFSENSYFLIEKETGEAVAFDPGDEPALLLGILRKRGLKLRYILNTHAHIDHVGAVQALKEATGAPFYLHPAESGLLQAIPAQAAMFGLVPPPVPEVDGNLAEGQVFHFGSKPVEIKVHDTPGHSPGGVTFEVEGLLFAGDTLFESSIGRTDLPGGDAATLLDSIHRKLLVFPDATIVYPGHGPSTTIGAERRWNPFLQRDS